MFFIQKNGGGDGRHQPKNRRRKETVGASPLGAWPLRAFMATIIDGNIRWLPTAPEMRWLAPSSGAGTGTKNSRRTSFAENDRRIREPANMFIQPRPQKDVLVQRSLGRVLGNSCGCLYHELPKAAITFLFRLSHADPVLRSVVRGLEPRLPLLQVGIPINLES